MRRSAEGDRPSKAEKESSGGKSPKIQAMGRQKRLKYVQNAQHKGQAGTLGYNGCALSEKATFSAGFAVGCNVGNAHAACSTWHRTSGNDDS
jgi:hypothetical protein